MASNSSLNKLEENQEQKGDLSYHYWAGKTGEAPAAQAKKLTDEEAQEMERSNSGNVLASKWNSAGTWEEKSHNTWAISEITRRLEGLEATGLKSGELKISKVKEITGDANTVVTRGKVRHGFDFKIELKWEAKFGDAALKGTLEIAEASRETVEDDELEAEVKLDPTSKKAKADAQKQATTAAKGLLPSVRKQLEHFDKDFRDRVAC